MTDSSVVTTMPVAPAYANGGGFGGWGNDIWLIIIVLFLFGFGGFGGGYGNEASAAAVMYPWMNNISAMQTGFDTAALTSQLSGIQTSLTNGFAAAEVSSCNRATDALIAGYNNQIANMNQNFANQTAMNQGFNSLQSQLATCCCENRLATAQTQALVQSENCVDRQALSDGIRDIIANQIAGFQSIKDQMCNDKLDAKNEKIADLERQLSMAGLAASQIQQTSQLIDNNNLQTQYIVNRVAPYPVPAYLVTNPVTPIVSV